jgi:CRISPR/Cas system CSM-associated protein Csm2 small subunit
MWSGTPNRYASRHDLELKRSLTNSIRRKMSEEGLSITALADRMGTGRTAVRRILDATNTSITFRSMSRVAAAVGLRIKLTAEPASPAELGRLARRLAKSRNRDELVDLRARITRGFYGGA